MVSEGLRAGRAWPRRPRPCRPRSRRPLEAAASDPGARMLRLADNVFVIEHDDATDEWPHGKPE